MTGTGDDQGGNAALVATDEQFLHTVTSANVIEADAELWRTFEQFLGADPVGAWSLAEVTHRPSQKVDEQGQPTGEWELVSSAKWVRDPEAPSPIVQVTIADELPELDELEAA